MGCNPQRRQLSSLCEGSVDASGLFQATNPSFLPLTFTLHNYTVARQHLQRGPHGGEGGGRAVEQQVDPRAEVARVLRPGGRFGFTVPAPAFASRIMCEYGEKTLEMVNRRLGHYHYRSIDEWTECLDNVGLDVVMVRGHLPAATQRVWLSLDTLMVRRFRGRRVLDWIRGLRRRGLIPDALWIALWSGLLWRSFKRPVDDPGGYLIVAQRRL